MALKMKSLKNKIQNRFPNLFRKVWVQSNSPRPPKLSKEDEGVFVRWRLKVKFDLPEAYREFTKNENYLAAFLLIANLLEFHLMQKLFESLMTRDSERIPELAKKLRFLPRPLLNTAIKIICKFSKTKTPAYYMEKRYTLGNLISEAEKLGWDTVLIGTLRNFNGQRRLLIHKLCYLENVNKDIFNEAKRACNLANKIWDQLQATRTA